jgi:regulation of enolase protein 1 (concanavalin A-like superfamily)
MISDKRVRRLRELMERHKRLNIAAAQAGMDEKTARKYLRAGKLPSEMKAEHTWRTREDPFTEVWSETRGFLEMNEGLEAKTLFEHFQRSYPGRYADGQLRTFQRKVRQWRALEGPSKEVFFAQEHHPGHLCESDFTYMHELGVTIGGQPFDHLIYHFVLTYSNWETGSVCFSESLESLSAGFQDAVWKLGGVPEVHRTDRMSAAVQKVGHPEEFTMRYAALMRHYRITPEKTQARSPNENGDVEQRHYRFKRAVDQALMLRGSRDFTIRAEYAGFLEKLFDQLNAGRQKRFDEEHGLLRALPALRLDSCKRLGPARVSSGSLIRVQNNSYSVHSRLIGQAVNIRLYAEHLEIWYAQRCVDRIPRLRGQGKHYVQYRHVIDSLVKKPGAFENYRYREDMFPTSGFRRAYDELKRRHTPQGAAKEYLKILQLAVGEGETPVDRALIELEAGQQPTTCEAVRQRVGEPADRLRPQEIRISAIDVQLYDQLLEVQHA